MKDHPLKQLQQLWIKHIHQSNFASLQPLIKSSAFDGPSVYRNSREQQLQQHLLDIHPCCQRFVGFDFWQSLIRNYVKLTPSTDHDINDYGKSLHHFIKQYEPAQDIVALDELCQLEWLLHTLKFFPPSPPFPYNKFSKLDESDIQRVQFKINPSASLITSACPLYQIWEMNYYELDTTINLDDKAEDVIIYQNQHSPKVMKITENELFFIKGIMQGKSWAEMNNSNSLQQDINSLLNRGLQQHWITNYSIKE